MNKAELLNWLHAQHERWEALLAQIGPARLEEPGVNGEWSMKDLIAHLTAWHLWLVARLAAAQRGQPEPSPRWPAALTTDDEINAWIGAADHGRPLAEVLDESRQMFRQLFAVIHSLPDDVRIEPEWHLVYLGDERFPTGEFFDHFRLDHEPDVRAWLARTATAA